MHRDTLNLRTYHGTEIKVSTPPSMEQTAWLFAKLLSGHRLRQGTAIMLSILLFTEASLLSGLPLPYGRSVPSEAGVARVFLYSSSSASQAVRTPSSWLNFLATLSARCARSGVASIVRRRRATRKGV